MIDGERGSLLGALIRRVVVDSGASAQAAHDVDKVVDGHEVDGERVRPLEADPRHAARVDHVEHHAADEVVVRLRDARARAARHAGRAEQRDLQAAPRRGLREEHLGDPARFEVAELGVGRGLEVAWVGLRGVEGVAGRARGALPVLEVRHAPRGEVVHFGLVFAAGGELDDVEGRCDVEAFEVRVGFEEGDVPAQMVDGVDLLAELVEVGLTEAKVWVQGGSGYEFGASVEGGFGNFVVEELVAAENLQEACKFCARFGAENVEVCRGLCGEKFGK